MFVVVVVWMGCVLCWGLLTVERWKSRLRFASAKREVLRGFPSQVTDVQPAESLQASCSSTSLQPVQPVPMKEVSNMGGKGVETMPNMVKYTPR